MKFPYSPCYDYDFFGRRRHHLFFEQLIPFSVVTKDTNNVDIGITSDTSLVWSDMKKGETGQVENFLRVSLEQKVSDELLENSLWSLKHSSNELVSGIDFLYMITGAIRDLWRTTNPAFEVSLHEKSLMLACGISKTVDLSSYEHIKSLFDLQTVHIAQRPVGNLVQQGDFQGDEVRFASLFSRLSA